MIIGAKNQSTFDILKKDFDERGVLKAYLALVVGSLEKAMKIESPIAHHPKKKDRMVLCNTDRDVDELKGRVSRTYIEPLKIFHGKGSSHYFTLVRAVIKKGLRHQIRVHLASIGHPILADRIYGPQHGGELTIGSHFLHACGIEFVHPITQTTLCIISPLPENLRKILNGLWLVVEC